MTRCDCIHDKAAHDPSSGACLDVNPVHGACPCDATPEDTRKTLNYVTRTHLKPEFQRLQKQIDDLGHQSGKEWRAMAELASKLMSGTEEEVGALRAGARWADLQSDTEAIDGDQVV